MKRPIRRKRGYVNKRHSPISIEGLPKTLVASIEKARKQYALYMRVRAIREAAGMEYGAEEMALRLDYICADLDPDPKKRNTCLRRVFSVGGLCIIPNIDLRYIVKLEKHYAGK